MATTHTAQEVISTCECLFESFIADNYIFLNMTELIEWAHKVIKPFKDGDEPIDSFLRLRSFDDVKDRLMSKVMDTKDSDDHVLDLFLDSLTDEELSVLYYKNNLIEFIRDHYEIQDLILEIFENVENLEYADKNDEYWMSHVVPVEYQKEMIGKTYKDWNKFVNIHYFMDPNNVPETIADTLFILKEYCMKYIYCDYLAVDRIYRLKNFKRRVVTVIDTDSNILSLDTIVDFIFDEIVKGETFGRDFENNVYICVNMLAYILTDAVSHILATFGEHSYIPEDYRPIFAMKNEFFFRKLIIGKTKKRYISKILLREGNMMNPPEYDIKGFDFKKATCSEHAEKIYMKILKEHVIDGEIEIKEILKELTNFKEEIRQSIKSGEITYLPNGSAKELAAYADPGSEQSVRGVLTWNMLNPNNMIDVPSKVSLLKLNIFKEEDIEDLKETRPEEYKIIIDNIFNDKTGIFVVETKNPGIDYVNTNDDKWYKNIPKKYQSKYRKLGPLAWNEFVDTIDWDTIGDDAKPKIEYKKRGMQCIAIPSNSLIPEWLQPYIDYSTMINNILSPFLPVLEIFQSKTVEEGKTKNGVNRKSNAFTNIVKF